MHFSAKIISAAALCVLAGCSSWNPFASKSEKNVPAALWIKPTLSVKQLWSVQVGSSQNYVFSPAIVGQQFYVAAADGTLVRIDAASGRADWRINAGVRLTGGVGANARTVVVAGDKGGLFAFDNEGKLRWKNQDSTEILSAPALSDSLVVVRSIDNKISAYDVETGARKWVVERTLPALTYVRSVWSLPVIR
jgi:outer membrane protein assembly factor BamB